HSEPLWLEADPTRLVQIIANLLGNAAKFASPGGRAEIQARRDGAWIEIRVRDDGAGIPPAQMPKLFRMFSQAHSPIQRTHGGFGIGLALSRGLVEQHGGTIEARSEGAGCGSEFIVRLPAAAAPAQAAPMENASVKVAPRKILVADDNRDAAD